MFGDKLAQREQISVGLSCGLCGEPAEENHICKKNLQESNNKEQCQEKEVQK